MLKNVLGIALFLLSSLTAFCQCSSPPEEFYLVEKEDYKALELVSFDLMNCLVLKPNELSQAETEEAEAFCLIWLGGTPEYRVEVNTHSALFLEERPEYFYTYVFASALVERDFPEYSSVQKEVEALFLLSQYEKNKFGSFQLKILKKVEKLYEKGKLEHYLLKQKN